MRKMNFFAGPSVLPVEVLEQLKENIVDYKGKGLSSRGFPPWRHVRGDV